jgi:protein TonB
VRFFCLEAKVMAPSIHTEVPLESPAKKTEHSETLVLEPRKAGQTPAKAAPSGGVVREEGSFQSSVLEYNRMAGTSRPADFLISLVINLSILAAPVFAGLYFTDTINLKQFEQTFLVAPPPPPPPPPAAPTIVKAMPPPKVFENAGKLVAPAVIPKTIAEIKESPLPPDVDASGVAGGVPGGVAGGSMGGVIGGVIDGVSTIPTAPIAPRDNKPKAPIRVGGGRVREPRATYSVEPVYPALARQTHIQGTVVIDAVLDEHGNVVEMKVVSGPPLLIQAAMDAVGRWKYEPTYLNDEPVPVQLNVTVTFRLN